MVKETKTVSIIPWRLACLALAGFTLVEHAEAFGFSPPTAPQPVAQALSAIRAPDAGLKVFITDEWAQRHSDAEPAPPATLEEIEVAESGWSAQVGAFKERDRAAALLERLGQGFTVAPPAIDGGTDGYYRARFTGLSRRGAEDLCARLQARAQGCIAIGRAS